MKKIAIVEFKNHRIMKKPLKKADSYTIENPTSRAKRWIRKNDDLKATIDENVKLMTASEEDKKTIFEKDIVIDRKEEENAVMKPYAEYTTAILSNQSTITMNQISKDYDMAAQRMNKLLLKFEIQYCLNGEWILYTKYHGRGYTHAQVMHYHGTTMFNRWTQNGKKFIYDFLKFHNIVPVIENKNIFYSISPVIVDIVEVDDQTKLIELPINKIAREKREKKHLENKSVVNFFDM
ncbi:phage antirepressor KilAC domain-containing protein [Clostridium estertheticum]|uniref:phage antirepressor KilAC domain-containing protein n=1 Tax=Clostridium estertheticum TaxID=238834 RepID=UPI001CF277DD|nr:phage antirepressor KilAC domain-containing protein [Clostridium estertheticum]MCB2354709.1 phage antirepressor KilAC domain-containing protein [Clostridium estertheticum]WAG40952.1 phage antirepressor KilAC domain-containing protein [Clostridium estertheticum]